MEAQTQPFAPEWDPTITLFDRFGRPLRDITRNLDLTTPPELQPDAVVGLAVDLCASAKQNQEKLQSAKEIAAHERGATQTLGRTLVQQRLDFAMLMVRTEDLGLHTAAGFREAEDYLA